VLQGRGPKKHMGSLSDEDNSSLRNASLHISRERSQESSLISGCRPAIFWPCRSQEGIPVSPEQSPAVLIQQPNDRGIDTNCLISWLESELKQHLVTLSQQVESLASKMDTCQSSINALQQASVIREQHLARPYWKNKSPFHSESDRSNAEQMVPKGKFKLPTPRPLTSTEEEDGTTKESSFVRRSFTLNDLTDALASHAFFRQRGTLKASVWECLEDPDSSVAAKFYAKVWVFCVLMSVLFTLLQSVHPSPVDGHLAAVVEIALDMTFIMEVALRFFVCPSRLGFIRSTYNIIDIVSLMPLVLRFRSGLHVSPASDHGGVDLRHFVLLCIVPVLRLLKLLRHFQQFHLFVAVLRHTREALQFLLFLLALIVLVFSSSIFLVEPRDNISSLPRAMWLTIVTMTTVGYGDVTPDTYAGHSIVSLLVISSVLYMAMPIGILGNAFTEVWKDRDRILLTRKFSDRLQQSGYTSRDIPVLFRHFDQDGDGLLDLQEFRLMINEMQVGLRGERVAELFASIDTDGSGGVEVREFVFWLFPGKFHEIFKHNLEDKNKRRSALAKFTVKYQRKGSKSSLDSTPRDHSGSVNNLSAAVS